MKTIPKLVLSVLMSVIFLAGIASADDDDHERARDALEAGEVLPLNRLLDEVATRIDGEVVSVEIEREHGRYYYELKIVAPGGRLREVLVDALTAEIVEHEED